MITAARRFLAIGLLSVAGAVSAGEKAAPTGAEIEALIEQLASPNPKPITGREDKSVAPDYRLPPGFDKVRQRSVIRARGELRKLGPAAFSVLIKHWGDERYSVTTSHGLSGYCNNQNVGWVCEAIVLDQLQPYSTWPRTDDDPRGKPKRPNYPEKFLSTAEDALKWCEARRDKSLYDMQLEVLDWVIAEEAKRSGDYTDAEQGALREIRRELVGSKLPLKAGNFFLMDIEL
jgi:hypothetical protein